MVIENMTMYHSLLALKECIRAMDNNKSGGSKYYWWETIANQSSLSHDRQPRAFQSLKTDPCAQRFIYKVKIIW